MGALGLVLGYVSSKSIFFIGATIVALAIVAVIFREVHGGKHFEDTNRRHTDAMANAAMDADAGQMRSNIISTIANMSIDPSQTSSTVDQVVKNVIGDQQIGGPLDGLSKERSEGRITGVEYKGKMLEYIKNLAANHSIALREMTVR